MKKQTPLSLPIPVLAAVRTETGILAQVSVGLEQQRQSRTKIFTRVIMDTHTSRFVDRQPAHSSRQNPVHRLDRDTSGVLLLAGARAIHRHFAARFEARQVDKRYLVILHGRLEQMTPAGRPVTWKWTLTKTPGGRKNPRGKGPRVHCTTHVKVLGHSDHYTLAQCRLLTGRKHQIRRHARQAGHFVVGDRRYGSKRALEFLKHKRNFERLGLHAARIDIQLPDGSPLSIDSAELPVDMQRLLDEDGYTPVAAVLP